MKRTFITSIIMCMTFTVSSLCYGVSKTNKTQDETPMIELSKDGEMITYNGPTNFIGFELFKEVFEHASVIKIPSFLVIKSLGEGDYSGMIFGRFIHKHNINVQVDKFCISSCAKYIFPAAKIKYIKGNATVGFIVPAAGPTILGHVIPLEQILTASEKFKKQVEGDNTKHKLTKEILDKQDKTLWSLSKQLENKYYPEKLSKCQGDFVEGMTKSEQTQLHINSLINCTNFKEDQEKAFYKSINVDVNLPYIGIEKFKEVNIKNKDVMVFSYEKALYEKLGVSNIKYDNNRDVNANKLVVEVFLADWKE